MQSNLTASASRPISELDVSQLDVSQARVGVQRLYFPLLMLLCVAFAWRPLNAGDDFWAHAAVGRWMWEHGQVPRETVLLWSARVPWVWHSWGSQLLFYTLMHAGGERFGPLLAQLLACLGASLSFALLWRVWAARGRITLLTPVVFAFAIWVAGARFHPRPELFSALFLLSLLIFLVSWPRDMPHRTTKAVAVIAMFALWANLHGGVALGLLILWASVACELWQTRADKRSRTLLWLAVACTLAINLNPWGAGYWSALTPVSAPGFRLIDEWKPMWASPAMPLEALLAILMLALLPLFAWLQAPRGERRLAHLAWLLVLALMMASARRHLWSFALVSLLVCALYSRALEAGRVWRAMQPRRQTPVRNVPSFARFAAPVLVCALLFSLTLAAARPELWRGQARADSLPDNAANYLRAHAKNGPVWNEYLISSYLQWRLAGRPALSIDLLNAYPDHALTDYFEVMHATPRGLRLLQTSPARLLILPQVRDKTSSAPLRRFLQTSRVWKLVYKDADALIYQRDAGGVAASR